jgi:alkylation response protein AidB-like acyl-CoA dehydrogenase
MRAALLRSYGPPESLEIAELPDPRPRAGQVAIAIRAASLSLPMAAGVTAEALRLTAEYTETRQQFDQLIATFQAVAQRAADAFIDTEAVRLTALQAAWRIDAGLPAEAAVATAKFWAQPAALASPR